MPTIDRSIGSYHDASNARIRKIGRMVGPASYTTGGDPCAPSVLGLGKVEILLFTLATDGTNIRLLVYDHTALTVKWFDLAGAQIANGTDLSTYSARYEAIGY
jgi:hypothetical protein